VVIGRRLTPAGLIAATSGSDPMQEVVGIVGAASAAILIPFTYDFIAELDRRSRLKPLPRGDSAVAGESGWTAE